MNGVRLGGALLLIALPALIRPIVQRSRRPGVWAVVSVFSLGTGFVLVEAGLIHATLPHLFSALGAERLAEACRHLGGHLFGGSSWFGLLAGFLAVTVAARMMSAVAHTTRAYSVFRHDASDLTQTRLAGQDTVLAPISSRTALAVPGRSPYILLSLPLVADLHSGELAAVIRHEASHLRNHHERFLLVGTVVGHSLWFVPWAARAAATLRLALERWADEEAASGPSEREQVRSALSKLGNSPLVFDRLRALHGPEAVTAAPHAGGWSAASVIIPLGLALVVTLVLHLIKVFQTAAG